MADSVTCTKCGQSLPPSSFHKNSKSKVNCQPQCKGCCSDNHRERYQKDKKQILEQSAAYYRANADKRKAYHKKLRSDKKEQVYSHYGKTCVCCGETETAFLTIDHINNDGAAHRREINAASIYDHIIKERYPDTFQVLCVNCNWAKSRGGCPHQNKSKLPLTQS